MCSHQIVIIQNTLHYKDGDHEMIQHIFGLASFNVKTWMESLTPQKMKEYEVFVETEKHDMKRQTGTINFIAEYIAMKDIFFIIYYYLFMF